MTLTHSIPLYDWNYAHIEWSRGLSFYIHRLRQIGFDGRDGLFLDAGCGTGQWVDALSSLGKEVVGVDTRESRLEIASIFLRGRTHLIRASLDALPLRDGLFSSVICYGVIMFTDPDRTLFELSRVCAGNALLYVCWNALGWSLYLLLSGRHGWKSKLQAVQTILNTWRGKRGTKYLSKNRMIGMLGRAGFGVLACNSEGHISIETQPRPVYQRRFLGLDNVLEVLASRRVP